MVEKTDLLWFGIGIGLAYYASRQFPGIVPKSLSQERSSVSISQIGSDRFQPNIMSIYKEV